MAKLELVGSDKNVTFISEEARQRHEPYFDLGQTAVTGSGPLENNVVSINQARSSDNDQLPDTHPLRAITEPTTSRHLEIVTPDHTPANPKYVLGDTSSTKAESFTAEFIRRAGTSKRVAKAQDFISKSSLVRRLGKSD